MIPLFKVFMPESVLGPVSETLMSGYIGQGPKVDEFEDKLRNYLGYQSLVTVNSGTAGLELALQLAGVNSGSEVISSPLTCTATNWPVLLSGANLVWADVDVESCNINPTDVERKITDKTKAILCVHWGGYPCELDELLRISGEYNIPLIEDGAHAFGSQYKGRMIGSFGDYCMFSFQAIKTLTTVDGGCLTVPHEQLRRAKLLRWYGIDREGERSDFRCEANVIEAGRKAHMNDVCATIGIEQMKYVNETLRKQRENASYYNEALKDTDVHLLQQERDRLSAYWQYTIRVKKRDDFVARMKEHGIMTSRVHERNDVHTCTRRFQTELPGVSEIVGEMVSIPVGWWVTKENREYIVDCIKSGW